MKIFIKKYYIFEIIIILLLFHIVCKIKCHFDCTKNYLSIINDELKLLQIDVSEMQMFMKETKEEETKSTDDKITFLDEKTLLKYKNVTELKQIAVEKYNIPKEKLNKLKKDELINEIEAHL